MYNTNTTAGYPSKHTRFYSGRTSHTMTDRSHEDEITCQHSCFLLQCATMPLTASLWNMVGSENSGLLVYATSVWLGFLVFEFVCNMRCTYLRAPNVNRTVPRVGPHLGAHGRGAEALRAVDAAVMRDQLPILHPNGTRVSTRSMTGSRSSSSTGHVRICSIARWYRRRWCSIQCRPPA